MNSITAASAETQKGTAAAVQKTGLTTVADFNMFLKLLTTQMQNQDPLDPMDTSQYTQQLVQYSQVEQSVQQTSALKEILARLSGQDMAQAASFLGRTARYDSPVAGLGGTGSATRSYDAARPAAAMTATITDAAGIVVHRRSIEPGQSAGAFEWDGMTGDGKRAAAGAYTLTISAVDATGAEVPVSIAATGPVTDVTLEAGQVMLRIGGISIPLARLLSVSA